MDRTRLRSAGLLAALVALVALSAGGGSSRAAAAGATISASSLNATIGTISKVEVSAAAMPAPGLAAWTIDIHYDPSLVTILSCAAEHGGLCNPQFNENTVRVSGTDLFGLAGDAGLASIGLACKVAGEGQLEVSPMVLADATIGNPQPIAAAAENGSVTCKSDAPEPTATPTEPKPTASPPASEPKLPGDADCNGTVNPIDAALMLQYTAHTLGAVGCPDDGDVNHDGSIDSIDAALTLQKSAGLF